MRLFTGVPWTYRVKQENCIRSSHALLLFAGVYKINNNKEYLNNCCWLKSQHMFDVGSKETITDMDSKRIATALVCQPCWVSCKKVRCSFFCRRSVIIVSGSTFHITFTDSIVAFQFSLTPKWWPWMTLNGHFALKSVLGSACYMALRVLAFRQNCSISDVFDITDRSCRYVSRRPWNLLPQ